MKCRRSCNEVPELQWSVARAPMKRHQSNNEMPPALQRSMHVTSRVMPRNARQSLSALRCYAATHAAVERLQVLVGVRSGDGAALRQ